MKCEHILLIVFTSHSETFNQIVCKEEECEDEEQRLEWSEQAVRRGERVEEGKVVGLCHLPKGLHMA